jgi:hypothetical protein
MKRWSRLKNHQNHAQFNRSPPFDESVGELVSHAHFQHGLVLTWYSKWPFANTEPSAAGAPPRMKLRLPSPSFQGNIFMWLYHRGVELPITNYTFLYKVNDVRQGFSKGEDAGEGLVRRRGEAPTLTRDMGNVMQIQEARALPSHAAPASAVPLLHGLACRGSAPLCHPRPDAQLAHLPVPLTGSVPLHTGFSPPCVRTRLPERP